MIVFHYLQFEMVVYLIDDMIAYRTVYTIAGMKDSMTYILNLYINFQLWMLLEGAPLDPPYYPRDIGLIHLFHEHKQVEYNMVELS